MTRSDITFGTLLVLGELHRPDKSALLAEGAFFFLACFFFLRESRFLGRQYATLRYASLAQSRGWRVAWVAILRVARFDFQIWKLKTLEPRRSRP